ncbi:plasmid pRiA4b ORF-3 family protein [uncultured Catenibacterium sp.]|uniref:plasmid pRiA4b ORF-3 family protein n=1 Tax=uncultured Catenibacterium sp. TaxID=286142 RepID=UPI0025E8662B|nr:plasmid pRiA4b ORF-3 family protein [uncultured Catenibacterium sp.]
MYIQCTKALLDKLKIEKSELLPVESCEEGAEGFYSWHAHFITINRRKAIVCMNNLTRYTIVLYRPKAKDMMELESRIKEGIRTAFCEEGISEVVINEYIETCGVAEYSKTAGRSMVAYLNKICEVVQWYADLLDEDTVIQKRISMSLGKYFVKFDGDYDHPTERLFRALCKMRNLSESEWDRILEVENYQLKIRLNFENFDIWRRVLIPSSCTFQRLHRVIQETFGWFDYHLHEFQLIGELEGADHQLPLYAYPIKLRIVDGEDPEAGEYLEPDKYEVKFDTKTSLEDVFKDTDTCIYTYDFGDNWEHVITLEKVIENNNRFPVLLERNGERPPEDVGGESGFEEYMRIISDKNHPQHEAMLQWSEFTKEKERTIEEINRRMKHFFR